jgi:hypothetical protein
VSGWTDIFLGVIAAATLITSILQVGVLVAAGRLAMRLMRLVDRMEREVKPLIGHLDAIGRDAARATSLAAAQVERADGLFADLAQRVESTMDTVQSAAGMPAREGAAIMAGFRAAFSTLRSMRGTRGRRARGEDEDALFI